MLLGPIAVCKKAKCNHVPLRRYQLAQTAYSAQIRQFFWPLLHQPSQGARDMILHFCIPQ